MEVTLLHYLFISTALFFIGVYGFFTRRNMISMLIAVELILNAVNINFIAFNKFLFPQQIEGLFFTLFIITIAAAEAAVAIAIIISVYRRFNSINADSVDSMKFWKQTYEFFDDNMDFDFATGNIPHYRIAG